MYKIPKDGSEKARIVAEQTLKEVKSSMKINYFDNNSLICEHIEKYKNMK